METAVSLFPAAEAVLVTVEMVTVSRFTAVYYESIRGHLIMSR